MGRADRQVKDPAVSDATRLQNPGSKRVNTASREISSSFSNEGRVHGDQHPPNSQKKMLSKALQKANTAVLLDNAANFEGAMRAYNDACQLLHSVMLNSSGSDIEKLKLQEIVWRPLFTVHVR